MIILQKVNIVVDKMFISFLYLHWMILTFQIVVERDVEEHGFLPLQKVNCKSVSVSTLLALPFKHLVLYLKDLGFIHKILMPSTSLHGERSVAELIFL